MSLITQYPHAKDPNPVADIAIDLFIHDIQEGKWEDLIHEVRTGKREKTSLPCVTISCSSTYRSAASIKKHSGYICIDVDKVDAEATKASISNDPYIYAAFTSCSGSGVAIIFQINPEKHAESFAALEQYLFEEYGLIADSSGKDVSRARFVSYDPNLLLNPDHKKFTKTFKPKVVKYSPVVFAEDDLSQMVSELTRRSISICNTYQEWRNVGFALSHQMGEDGRSYYHALASIHNKYTASDTDRQYTNCLKASGSGTPITIATLYHMAKQAGVQPLSKQTQAIATLSYQAKQGGADLPTTINRIRELHRIDATSIATQVFANNIRPESDEPIAAQVEEWIKSTYNLKLNLITRKLENSGVPLEDRDLNSIWLAAKKIYDTKLPNGMAEKIIHSNSIPAYNPLKDFILQHADRQPSGSIVAYCKAFKVSDPLYFRLFFEKWFTGVVSSIFGQHSPLMLILVGGQNLGKTRALRDLLPKEIKHYYAESKLNKGTDDEIMMTQKLIICDDEMSGKSKKDALHLKEITSKDIFTLRAPYGHFNMDLKRLAVLCGTTNDPRLLSDPTGNRRMLPMTIDYIDFDAINSVDRIDMLIEAYHAWTSGQWTSELTNEDIKLLNRGQTDFIDYSTEYEMITSKIKPYDGKGCEELTASEISNYLEAQTSKRLNVNKLGLELKRIGFRQEVKKYGGITRRIYYIQKLGTNPLTGQPEHGIPDENPF